MKIIAITRTLNEERNIARFCGRYTWADKVLVADGGSIDDTLEIAKQFSGWVDVRPFEFRMQMKKGLWRNPEAEHLNFLVDWAVEEGADWIFLDDCDCYPNVWMEDNIRNLIKETNKDFILATRLYLWGKNQHFPDLAKPGKCHHWDTSIWGWRADLGIEFYNTEMAYQISQKPEDHNRFDIYPPLCLMHNPWPDEEATQKKLNFYRNSGQIPNMLHPLEFGGKLETLPTWAY